MTGMEFEEIDDTVQDAIGEICNMLAGAWKGKVPELAAHCGLSVPAVITGCDYNLHVQAPEFQLHHVYRFDEDALKSDCVRRPAVSRVAGSRGHVLRNHRPRISVRMRGDAADSSLRFPIDPAHNLSLILRASSAHYPSARSTAWTADIMRR